MIQKMELPQIAEDDQALKTQLYELIQQRYSLNEGQKNRFNFQSGQMATIRNMSSNPKLIQQLSKLLSVYLKSRVQNCYCYYTVKGIVQNSLKGVEQMINSMQVEQAQIINKQSVFHKTNHLIIMREALLAKFQNKNQITKEIEQFIDDIRFINEEITKIIKNWKNTLQKNGINQAIIYVYKNSNYLVKIISDNQNIIKEFNYKQNIFQTAPNPFFLMNSHKLTGISVDNINKALEILAQQRAIELKMMIESPILKSMKNAQLQQELAQLKQKVEDQKSKTSYKFIKNDLKESRVSRIVLNTDERLQNIIDKNNQSIKNLDQLIKQKEIEALKQMKKKKQHKQEINTQQPSPEKRSSLFGYKSRIQNLRAQIQKNVKINTFQEKKKQKVPKMQTEIKQAKPKIKIIVERQTNIQNNVNAILDMIIPPETKNSFTKSKSTFYKDLKLESSTLQPKIKGREETARQKNIMISSAYNYSSLPSQRASKSTLNFKLRKQSGSKSRAKLTKQERDKSKSRQDSINQVNESLALLNTKIRQKTIKNIYSNKSAKKQVVFQKQQKLQKQIKISQVQRKIEYKSRKIEKKQEVVQKKEELELKADLNEKQPNLQQYLKDKQAHIQQLKEKLKVLRLQKVETNVANKKLQNQLIQKRRKQVQIQQMQKRKEKLKQERQQLQMQNMKIKQQMQEQEKKYLELKQRQYKLKEDQIQTKYKQELKKIKEQQDAQAKEFQLKIAEQRKKNKQNQQKLKEVTVKSEMIKNQLQQKEIKQKLYQQLLKEQTAMQVKLNRQKQLEENNKRILQQFIKKQDAYKRQLELKAVQTFEQEKLKLSALHLEMKRKNQLMEKVLHMKQLQIKRLEEENKKQELYIQQIEKEIVQKDKQKELAINLNLQQKKQVQQIQIQPTFQIEEVKKKLKQQIINEIKRKQQIELEEQARYEEERKRKLQDLEEQMRKAIKLQDEQLQRIEQQYRIKSEQLLRKHQQQLMRQLKQKERIEQQSNQKIKKFQQIQLLPVEHPSLIETGLQKKQITTSKTKDLETKKIQTQKQKEITKPNLVPVAQQTKSIIKLNEVKTQQPIAPKNQPEKIIAQQKQSPNKLVSQPSKITQTVKQTTEEIISKYNILLSSVNNPVKQIYISADQIESYISRFFQSLSVQVKQMLPFNANEMKSLLKDKKIDIFDHYSLGWYKPKDRKFLLVGSYQCIPIIAAKYGQVQVEQMFIFNKGNAYQKQYLSKLIKVYQKIGYIYQKKTNQQSMYSIKFIVKVPKESNKFNINITDCLQINTSLRFQQHKMEQQQLIKHNCIYYLLTQGLKELLTQPQKIQLAGKNDLDSKCINKRINDSAAPNNSMLKGQTFNGKVTELKLTLPLQYIQTETQAFFTLKATQYQISTQQQKLYFTHFSQQKIAIIIHKMQASSIPHQFNLDNYIQTRLRKMQKQTQLQLFVPIWQNDLNFKYKGNSPYSFNYKQQTQSNLAYGSIVNSKVRKGNFLLMEPPFAFLIFEVSQNEVLRRILYGHIVKESEIFKNKRIVTKF